jgi:hypothetical protein
LSRNQEIKSLKKDIKNSKYLVDKARDKIAKSGFKMEDISRYNAELHKAGILKVKLKRAEKYNKPEQYMDEVSIPGHINL